MKKQDLLNALELVKPGLAAKELIAQTTSFVFVDGHIITYNDEISVQCPFADITFTGAVPATELYTLLNRIKQEDIELEVKDNELHLTSGKSRAGITLMQEVMLPLEEIGNIGKWTALPENFVQAIKMAMYSCSRSLSKPILNCVHVNKEGFVEGTDNYRVAHYKLSSVLPIETFLIPSSTVQALIKMSIKEIAEGQGWIHFKTTEGCVVSCRTMSDKFPKTADVLAVQGESLTFPSTMVEILDRAMVFAKRDNALDEIIEIDIDKNKIKVKSQNISGWFEEEAPLKYKGNAIHFNVTPGLLKEILQTTSDFQYTDRFLKFQGEDWIFIAALRAS